MDPQHKSNPKEPDQYAAALPIKFNKCPLCRYLLDGLPTRHRCPECGFDYDRRSDVIHQGNKIAIFFLACTPLIVLVFSSTLRPVFSGERRLGIGDVVPILACLYAARYAIRFFLGRQKNMAIVGHAGIQLFRGRESVRHIPWTDFDEVRYNRMGGDAGLRKNGRVIETIEQGFFGSDRKTRQFIAIANEWKQRSLSQS